MTDTRPANSNVPPDAGPKPAQELTSKRIKRLAQIGLHTPSKLSLAEIQELAGSVVAHIIERGPLG